jgi:hypothetical protein
MDNGAMIRGMGLVGGRVVYAVVRRKHADTHPDVLAWLGTSGTIASAISVERRHLTIAEQAQKLAGAPLVPQIEQIRGRIESLEKLQRETGLP